MIWNYSVSKRGESWHDIKIWILAKLWKVPKKKKFANSKIKNMKLISNSLHVFMPAMLTYTEKDLSSFHFYYGCMLPFLTWKYHLNWNASEYEYEHVVWYLQIWTTTYDSQYGSVLWQYCPEGFFPYCLHSHLFIDCFFFVKTFSVVAF